MRVSRIAAITVMGAAAFGVSATSAYAGEGKPGKIEASPHAVKPGHVVRLSTEACHTCAPAKVHVDIDGKRHLIKLHKRTPEGKTAWFKVPRDADPGRYEVEGHCKKNGREIEGSFWVKKEHHEKAHHEKAHHEKAHHEKGCHHEKFHHEKAHHEKSHHEKAHHEKSHHEKSHHERAHHEKGWHHEKEHCKKEHHKHEHHKHHHHKGHHHCGC